MSKRDTFCSFCGHSGESVGTFVESPMIDSGEPRAYICLPCAERVVGVFDDARVEKYRKEQEKRDASPKGIKMRKARERLDKEQAAAAAKELEPQPA